MTNQRIGILGLGHALPGGLAPAAPTAIEGPGDAERAALFVPGRERRWLAPGESLSDLMYAAAQSALAAAALPASAIDRLYGYESVSEYLTPNGLFDLHRRLRLGARAMVVPVNSECTNFVTSVVLAWEAILAGHARHVLVDCGNAWSRHADPADAHAGVASDAAGAAVIGPSERLVLLDHDSVMMTDDYGSMTMKARIRRRGAIRYAILDEAGLAVPTYEITVEISARS